MGQKVLQSRLLELCLYCQVFAYLEPSLFGGAFMPTDSLLVLQQLMERIFGYNAGVVKGQAAKKRKDEKPQKVKGERVIHPGRQGERVNHRNRETTTDD